MFQGCASPSTSKVRNLIIALSFNCLVVRVFTHQWHWYSGRTYDLGGQVIAANSAPVITHLAKELGSEFEEMDSHKLALIDSKTRNIRDLEVAEDYVSMVSLTLKLQVSCSRISSTSYNWVKRNMIFNAKNTICSVYLAVG